MTDPSITSITFAERQGIALVTLDRPAVLNAINRALNDALEAALDRCLDDDRIRALVLTGSGRAFCAGADLKELGGPGLGGSINFEAPTLIDRVRLSPKLTIAAVNGLAVGGGCSLALACDLRIGCASSAFELNFVKAQIVPEGGSTFMLPRLIGWSRALELLLSGRRVGAAEALDLGLLNRVVESDTLVDAAVDWATELAAADAGTIKTIKELVQAGADRSYDEHRRHERRCFHESIVARRDKSQDGTKERT